MLVPGKAVQALAGKRDAFRQAAAESAQLLEICHTALDRLAGMSAAEIAERLADEDWPGARPAEGREQGLIVPFAERWDSAQQARAWALERLKGVPTLAVDGSQIAASKEFAVPISLVQVGWFENHHDPDRPYIKDVRNEAVTADERLSPVEELVAGESVLNQRRFALELQTAVERMASLDPARRPVVFQDGSLVLSFISRLLPPARNAYLHALFGLLDAAEGYRIPVIGYIDLSFARDLAAMLRTVFDLPAGDVFDAQLLTHRMHYFDRTAAFECARGDVLPLYHTPSRDYSHDLCFVYLKMGEDRLPARLDFPRWVVEDGLLDHVVDIVRAEAVVGSGYPYALETADATAVLTTEDRLAFYRLFHEFARESGMTVSLPGKSLSKVHRRG